MEQFESPRRNNKRPGNNRAAGNNRRNKTSKKIKELMKKFEVPK